MRKFLKYLHIGVIAIWRVIFEYFQWILPCSRHPERKPLSYRYAKARSLITFILKHMGFDLRIENPDLLDVKGPTLYVQNHLSALDPLMLVALSPRPIAFISKKENAKIIIAGRLIKAIDGVFIDREDPFQTMKAFRVVADKMKQEGLSYCIFPEGTRNRDPYKGSALPFHPGSLKLAYMAKCPILVLAGFGSFHCFDSRKGLRHLWTLRPLEYRDYASFATLKTPVLSDHVEKAINEALPALIEADNAYESTKKKDKRAKWWNNLPVKGN